MSRLKLGVVLLIGLPLFATVYDDPIGDADPGVIYTHDIVQIEGTVLADELYIRVSFNDTISPTNSGNNDALFGYVYIWIDQDNVPQGYSCSAPNRANWGGVTDGGGGMFDFVLEFFPDNPDGVGFDPVLHDVINGPVGPQPAVWSTDSVEVRIPLAVINDDGLGFLGSVFGDQQGPTDCAPDQEPFMTSIGSTVPTMSEWGFILFTTVLLASVLVLRRRS